MKNKSKKAQKKVNFLSPKFPPYLTSHTKPQNLRRYIANKKRLNHMDRSPFNAWGKPKVIPKKKLTWPQAKIRFPLLKPMRDADKDGVINLLDCKPFDKKRQGFGHQYSFSYTDYPFTRTVKMAPNEFLRRTWEEGKRRAVYEKVGKLSKKVSLEEYKKQLRDLDKKTVDYLKKKIKSKKDKVAIGFIEMRGGKPSGHEGRHTAIAAEESGIKKIPVTIETYDKEDIKGYEPVRKTLQAEYAQEKLEDESERIIRGEEKNLHEKSEALADYDLNDHDDQTLDYDEEQEEK